MAAAVKASRPPLKVGFVVMGREILTRKRSPLATGYKQLPEQIAVIGSTKQIDTSIP
jgi:hypothetical protein